MQKETRMKVQYEGKLREVPMLELIIDDYDDGYDNIAKYYIRNAMGNRVFIKTMERPLAQLVIDTYYGKGHYLLKCFGGEPVKSKTGGKISVRAVGFRKNQAQQRARSAILNGK